MFFLHLVLTQYLHIRRSKQCTKLLIMGFGLLVLIFYNYKHSNVSKKKATTLIEIQSIEINPGNLVPNIMCDRISGTPSTLPPSPPITQRFYIKSKFRYRSVLNRKKDITEIMALFVIIDKTETHNFHFDNAFFSFLTQLFFV